MVSIGRTNVLPGDKKNVRVVCHSITGAGTTRTPSAIGYEDVSGDRAALEPVREGR